MCLAVIMNEVGPEAAVRQERYAPELGGTAFSPEYDNLAWLVRIPGYFEQEGQPAQKGFAYDANGFLTNATAVNGVSSAYATDAQGRLKTISVARRQPAESMPHFDYSYTPQGNVSCISGTNGGPPFELGYGYDWASRLTSDQVPKPLVRLRGRPVQA